MVASLENTMTKWKAVYRALLMSLRGKLRGSYELLHHNSPAYREISNHFNKAFSDNNNNTTMGGSRETHVRTYFELNPNKRHHITSAYNKLNNMYNQLANIRRKVIATSKIQKHWRSARPTIMNKRKVATLLALSSLPIIPNHKRVLFMNAFPKPVYGPKTELNTLRQYSKYPTY